MFSREADFLHDRVTVYLAYFKLQFDHFNFHVKESVFFFIGFAEISSN